MDDHRQQVQADTEAEVNRTLYVGSLSPQVTEDELRELFLQAGPLEKVTLLPNSTTAFVTFSHSVSVPYAKQLFYGTQLHGRYMVINFRHGSLHNQPALKEGTSSSYGYNNRYSSDSRDDRYQSSPGYSRHSSSDTRHHHSSYYDSRNRHSSDHDSRHHRSSDHDRRHRDHRDKQRVEERFQSRPAEPFTAQAPADYHYQGYSVSDTATPQVNGGEYVPTYVSFDNPPAEFRGPTLIIQQGADLQDRRARLISYQQHINQFQYQRNERQNSWR